MVLIEQLLTKDEVAIFREHLDQVSWLDGKGTAMGMSASVKDNAQADANDDTVKQLANALLAKYGETPKLVSAVLPQKIFPPALIVTPVVKPTVYMLTVRLCASRIQRKYCALTCR